MENLTVNKNIRLEALKPSMAKEIFETIQKNRNYLKVWLPFIELTQTISDTDEFIQSVLDQPSDKKDEIFGIWFNNNFVGLVGFKDTDWANQKTELGYWLSEEMQGKGIITKCVEKLIRYAFQKLRINRIQIKTAVGNSKSSAIPKRLGFHFEGIERAGEKHNRTFMDVETYSLLKADL